MKSRRVLVTGGSRGIGAAISMLLAKRGHQLAVHYGHNDQAARALIGKLEGEGHILLKADLTDPVAVRALAKEASAGLNGLDAIVNNAGIHEYHPPLETGAEAWEKVWRDTLDVNLLAPMLLSHAAIPLLKASGSGRIVNIGSRGGYRGEPGGPAYGSAKAGLHAGMQSMAQALAPAGIHVFSIAPGFVETDMVSEHLAGPAGDAIKAQSPLNRVAQPGEIARIVAFLLSGEGDWMTGSVLDANGASYLR